MSRRLCEPQFSGRAWMSNSSVIAVNHLPNYQDRSQRERAPQWWGSKAQRRWDRGQEGRPQPYDLGDCWANADPIIRYVGQWPGLFSLTPCQRASPYRFTNKGPCAVDRNWSTDETRGKKGPSGSSSCGKEDEKMTGNGKCRLTYHRVG